MSPGCYTTPKILELLDIPYRTLARALKNGTLPFLEELQPRTKPRRYKKEPVDRYLRGEWGAPRLVFGRRSAR